MTDFLEVYVRYWDEWWPEIQMATLNTIFLTASAYAVSLLSGLLLALGKLSRSAMLHRISIAYIEVMRGVPTLVILFIMYFGLVPMGLTLDAFTVGFLGLGLHAGAYVAEIFRAGIEAVHKGQREAALAVGMTPLKSFRYIVFPQAAQIMIPPLLNMLIIVLKDSSVCSLISSPELMLRAKDLASTYFRPMHLYLLVGLIYFLIAWPLSLMTRRIEIRMRRGRRNA